MATQAIAEWRRGPQAVVGLAAQNAVAQLREMAQKARAGK